MTSTRRLRTVPPMSNDSGSTVQAYDHVSHAAAGELDRLQALAEVYDPTTQTLLASLVKPGMRCLDVGAGAGAVSAQLATLVGAAGKVVAIDIETTFLQPLAAAGIDVMEHDITAAPFPGPQFDLVVSRFVLEWISAREQALRHMLESLRRGGVLVVETGDWYSRIQAAQPPELDAVIAAGLELLEAGGYELDCGRRLPGRLQALGLKGIAGRTVSLLGRGGETAAARWALNSLERVAPSVLGRGTLTEAEIQGARKALADPGTWFWTAPAVAAWGWKSAD